MKVKVIMILCSFVHMLYCGYAYAQKPTTNEFYGVVFGIVINEKQELESLKVVNVLKPTKDGASEIAMNIPESFIKAAREMVLSKNYKPVYENGKPKEFYTYFIFDPHQPDRADIDPKEE